MPEIFHVLGDADCGDEVHLTARALGAARQGTHHVLFTRTMIPAFSPGLLEANRLVTVVLWSPLSTDSVGKASKGEPREPSPSVT